MELVPLSGDHVPPDPLQSTSTRSTYVGPVKLYPDAYADTFPITSTVTVVKADPSGKSVITKKSTVAGNIFTSKVSVTPRDKFWPV